VTNNQKEKLFSNKFIQDFLENESNVSLKNKYKFAEIASSLAYYLKSFSNINKLLDYISLIFKHIFNEKIILIIPLNYEGDIWNENIKIAANNQCFMIQEEINSFFNKFHFSKIFNIKDILAFECALKNNFYEYKIETKAGLKIAKYINDEITVKMGVPILESQNIPTKIEKKINSIPSHEFIEINFNNIGFAVGMGNPHLIFFVKDIESIVLSRLGPIFEKNELFPEKTNVHFCQILNRDNIKVKVWERGAGPTLACGTGACAIHVAAYKLGLCKSQTIVTLPGGDLKIDWSKDDCEVLMTGNAQKVFSGSMIVN